MSPLLYVGYLSFVLFVQYKGHKYKAAVRLCSVTHKKAKNWTGNTQNILHITKNFKLEISSPYIQLKVEPITFLKNCCLTINLCIIKNSHNVL